MVFSKLWDDRSFTFGGDIYFYPLNFWLIKVLLYANCNWIYAWLCHHILCLASFVLQTQLNFNLLLPWRKIRSDDTPSRRWIFLDLTDPGSLCSFISCCRCT